VIKKNIKKKYKKERNKKERSGYIMSACKIQNTSRNNFHSDVFLVFEENEARGKNKHSDVGYYYSPRCLWFQSAMVAKRQLGGVGKRRKNKQRNTAKRAKVLG